MTWVHPRMRGAGLVDRDLRVGDEGSPPHARGEPPVPACRWRSTMVYPRTRGEGLDGPSGVLEGTTSAVRGLSGLGGFVISFTSVRAGVFLGAGFSF